MGWAEAKWTVDSILQKIGQAPNNMRAFTAFPLSATSIGLRFLEPEDSYADGNLICAVKGVMIRMSTTGYPANPNEGILVVDNQNLGAYEIEPFVVDNLTEGTTYYFSAFPYSAQGVYNLSSNASNRATSFPAAGEVVTVNVIIDGTTGFTSATVTCVNETNPTATVSRTITPTHRTATFVVPIGDTYHIEYSEVDGYSKPSNTPSKVAIAGASTTYEATYSSVRIYGISRDVTSSSPVWTRTDSAVGKTATASVGTQAGSSDFDSCAPWSGIKRETLADTDDVMVKIPKFYFQRYKDGNIEHIRIADRATEGFAVHPLFKHAGVEKDYAYVGAYKTSFSNRSISGASPQVSLTRATFRANAKNKGDGWSLMDIAALSAIQMLILVEFATNDVQTAIGRGYCDGNSGAISTGSCDNVPNLTGRPSGTNGKTDVVWRGIEGLWGNVWEFVDGVNWNSGAYYVCNDPSKYADDTATGYTQLSFAGATNWSGSYITAEGIDTLHNNEHVMLPLTAGSGSESTYQCDACWSNTGWRVFQHGGSWAHGSICGLFTAALSYTSSYTYTFVGSRLLYIPS